MNVKKISTFAVLLALSVVLGLIESFIPVFNGIIPGVKLGLANIVIVFVIFKFSFKDAFLISILRVFIIGLLRTGIFSVTFFFSLFGAVFSVIIMFIVKKYTKLSVIGVSILGAISHSVGQIVMAIILLKTNTIILYLPYILLLSIPTGIFVGYIAKEILKHYEAIK